MSKEFIQQLITKNVLNPLYKIYANRTNTERYILRMNGKNPLYLLSKKIVKKNAPVYLWFIIFGHHQR